MSRNWIFVLLSLPLLVGVSGSVLAQEEPTPELVAKFKKAGADYGHFVVNEYGFLQFSAEQDARGLPGFRFRTLDDDKAAMLPAAAEVRMGLDLSGTAITEKGLKE